MGEKAPAYVRLAILNVVLFSAFGCLFPFLTAAYEAKGLTKTEIGGVTTCAPFVSFLFSPVWARLADKTKQHRRVLVASSLVAVVLMFLFPLVSFPSVVALMILYTAVTCPLCPLLDSFVLEALGEHAEMYGKVRVWGAVGVGVAAPVSGFLVDKMDLSVPFAMFGLLMTLSATLFYFWLKPCLNTQGAKDSYTAEAPNTEEPWSARQVCNKVCSSSQDVCKLSFLVVATFVGMGTSMGSSLSSLFLQDELLADRTYMGLATACTILLELPAFFFAKNIIQTIGLNTTIIVAQMAYVLRMCLYCQCVADNSYLFLVAELLHGVTFVGIWSAGVDLMRRYAAVGTEAFNQALFSACFNGLGGGTGSLLAGLLYETYGAYFVFKCAACVVLLSTALFLCQIVLVGKHKQTTVAAFASSSREPLLVKGCDEVQAV
eukprot:GILK01010547.1.p1 GENE.GILK01010547.1~~GILK01010547.1.p1  ORF type:complete len:439 (-),score=47.86 GILK01010547.1:140-1435(-)